MSSGGNKMYRPLSPFMPVFFRLWMTSGLSILHRMTGFALVVGIPYLIWWLVAAALGQGAYDIFMNFSGSPLGLFMLLGWTFCLYYHLANGIRHLFWDAGALLELKLAYAAGAFVVCFSLLMTLGTWAYVCYRFGGALFGAGE